MGLENESDIADAVAQLLQGVGTAQLATCTETGRPVPSYAPYLHVAGRGFFILVSELASHTRNMQRQPEAGLLIIADESASPQLFARERISFECEAEFIPRDQVDWQGYVEALEDKFGPVIKLIRDLKDFHLIALTPLRGIYIRGFGDAWSFEGADLDQFTHISSERAASNSSTDSV
jgi:putative heme iron utilization protein